MRAVLIDAKTGEPLTIAPFDPSEWRMPYIQLPVRRPMWPVTMDSELPPDGQRLIETITLERASVRLPGDAWLEIIIVRGGDWSKDANQILNAIA